MAIRRPAGPACCPTTGAAAARTATLSRLVHRQTRSMTLNEAAGDARQHLRKAARQQPRQPQVFVHRDYHSRNLMLSDPNPGVLVMDFRMPSFTYDLVSLFRDAYISWEEAGARLGDPVLGTGTQGRPADAGRLLRLLA